MKSTANDLQWPGTTWLLFPWVLMHQLPMLNNNWGQQIDSFWINEPVLSNLQWSHFRCQPGLFPIVWTFYWGSFVIVVICSVFRHSVISNDLASSLSQIVPDRSILLLGITTSIAFGTCISLYKDSKHHVLSLTILITLVMILTIY